MNQSLNDKLRDAVSAFDVQGVKACLQQGGDPNYRVEIIEPGAPGVTQPETLLQLVVFRISDCMLEDEDLEAFLEIARLLLSHGADPKPAIQLAEESYGKRPADADADDPFVSILDTIGVR